MIPLKIQIKMRVEADKKYITSEAYLNSIVQMESEFLYALGKRKVYQLFLINLRNSDLNYNFKTVCKYD